MQIGLIIVGTALLSSFLTVLMGWLIVRRFWQQELEYRLRQLHDDIGRTVETRVRRAVAESLNDNTKPSDMLRETTWKAAKSGTDLISDSVSVLLGKWRRQSDSFER
ncbi:MAG: hypothetical protein RJA86_287 [Pseudomonadota bacterium]|jgi:hypothetical protein|nr:hypothetical protein [Agitococcus sp.]